MTMLPPRPGIAATTPWRFPEPVVRQLGNGMATWAFHLPGQHVVSALLVLDVPLSAEPRDAEGIAAVTVNASDEGSLVHPGEELLDLMESAGAAYDASAGPSATVLGIDVPAPRLHQALPLLAEVARCPEHADADVERHLALRLAELEQLRISPPSLASLGLRQVLFDDSARAGRPQGGRAETLAAITPEMVRGFRARQWRPDGAVLVLAGELDDDVDAQVEALFGDWQPTGERAAHGVDLPAAAGTSGVVHLVDVPGAVQAEVRVGGIGVDRTSSDFAPLQVAANAIGGSFGSRLNTVLREEKGYTYGAHLSVHPGRLSGTWGLSTSVRTEVCADALADALAILALAEDLSADEVRDAVNNQLGIAPLRYDTAGAIASQAASLAAAGWGAEYVNLHFGRVAEVTPATATAAARRHLSLERARIVVAGDAAALRPQLEHAGFTVEELVVTL